MVPSFRRNRNDLGARVTRLIEEDRAARAAVNRSAMATVSAEATDLQNELVSWAGSGNLPAARALMDVSRVCLVQRLEAKNWLGAVACGVAMNTAAIRIFHGGGLEPDGLRALGYPDLLSALTELASRLYRVPEAVAYAAHRARQPLVAVAVIETLTNVVFEMRMNAPAWNKLEKRDAEGRLNWGEMEAYADRRRQIRKSARPAGSKTMSAEDL